MTETAMLRITCPSCGKTGNAPARLAGKTVRCSQCGTSFSCSPGPAAKARPRPCRAPPVPTAVPAPAPQARTRACRPPSPCPSRRARRRSRGPRPPVPAPSAPPRRPRAPAAPVPTMPEASPPPPAAPRCRPPPKPPPAVAGPREWRTGDVVLGLYEVAGLLGQGGMGRVYRVHHRGWGVDLAVKVPLKQALDAAGGVEAFEREAETWVNLPLHPHMVSCYYVRRLEGIPRVFAEFVDGGTLGDAIRTRRLSTLDSILDTAIQFAWGLHDAHEQGLVHRDVKPANVMITAEGVTKVTDFGLAGARIAPAPIASGSGDTTAMAAGGGGGTPAYMSPEQWAGKPLSRRTDVWSWGLSILEAFVGQRTWQVGPAASKVLEEHGRGGTGGRPSADAAGAGRAAAPLLHRRARRPAAHDGGSGGRAHRGLRGRSGPPLPALAPDRRPPDGGDAQQPRRLAARHRARRCRRALGEGPGRGAATPGVHLQPGALRLDPGPRRRHRPPGAGRGSPARERRIRARPAPPGQPAARPRRVQARGRPRSARPCTRDRRRRRCNETMRWPWARRPRPPARPRDGERPPRPSSK